MPFPHLFGSAILTHALCSGAIAWSTLPTFHLDEFLRMLHDYAADASSRRRRRWWRRWPRHPLIDRLDLSAVPARDRERRAVRAGAAGGGRGAARLRGRRLPRAHRGVVRRAGGGPGRSAAPSGRLAPNLEAMIVDPESGEPARPGRARRALDPRAAGDDAATSASTPTTPDGWFATGDLCRFDADGNLYMLDRLKELIKVGGYSVAPAEVERELIAHPAVADAAVVGHPDAELRSGAGRVRLAARTREPAELQALAGGSARAVEAAARGRRGRTRAAHARPASSCAAPFSRGHEPAELGPARHAELGEGRRQVVPDRALREVEAVADLAVREPLGGERTTTSRSRGRELHRAPAGARAATRMAATRAPRRRSPCSPHSARARSSAGPVRRVAPQLGGEHVARRALEQRRRGLQVTARLACR